MGYGFQSSTITATTTTQTVDLQRCWTIVFRAAATNTAAVYIAVDSSTTTTNELIVRAGETLSFDLSPFILGAILRNPNAEIDSTLFIRRIALRAASGSQTIYLDGIEWRGN